MAHKRSFEPAKSLGEDGSSTSKAGKIEHTGGSVKHKTKYGEWNFEVDYNDHFETPPIAYADLKNVLDVLCAKLGKTSNELVIYDPYWCKGNMVAHLAALGFTNVINKNRDFYNDIRCKQIPAYDILVTNPPYSGEHKVKLLSFLSSRAEPFALLLPAYTATKSYWRDFSSPPSSSSSSSSSSSARVCFYLMPPDHYEYLHPEGTGKDLPPFYSCWFLGGLSPSDKQSVVQRVRSGARRAATSSSGATASGLKQLPFSSLTVLDSVDAMVRQGIVTAQRPNPKQRQKLKKNLMTSSGANSGGSNSNSYGNGGGGSSRHNHQSNSSGGGPPAFKKRRF